jgi:hypothetical protein
MTSPRTPRAVAFVLSLFITLTIFSGVSSLAAPDHGGALLAQAKIVSES